MGADRKGRRVYRRAAGEDSRAAPAAEEAGRAKDSVEISIFGTAPDQNEIDRLGEIGVDRLIFSLPSAEREQVEPLLDRYAGLVG